MEIDIVKSSRSDLGRLQHDIQQGIRSTGVKDIEKWLMKGLADAIQAEHRRSDMIDGDLSDYDLMATVQMKIRRSRKHEAADPAKKRSLSSLMVELDDELASNANQDFTED